MHGNRILLIAAAGAISCLTACSDGASDVTPPAAAVAANAAAPTPTAPPAPVPSTAVAGEFDGRFDRDAAVTALRGYLREQALAINAGVADAAAVPAFTATLTPNGRSWALPLLAANLGDRMPGPTRSACSRARERGTTASNSTSACRTAGGRSSAPAASR